MGLNRLFRQDVTSNAYRRLADSLLSIIREHDHVVYVSGHDHNLQIFQDKDQNFFIVSGSGSHITPFAKHPSADPVWKDDTHTGFFRLEFNQSGLDEIKVYTPQSVDGLVPYDVPPH